MLPIVFAIMSLVAVSPGAEVPAPDLTPLPQLCKTWNLDERACAERIAKAGFTCERIGEHRLAGLSPAYPALACNHVGWDKPDEYVDASGCKFLVKHQYIFAVKKDGKEELVLVKTKAEFTKMFAPIESAEEALGFLTALTQAYGTKVIPKFQGGKWKVEGVRPTTLLDKGDEYIVRMFLQGNCGCYVPFLDELSVSIKQNGSFSTLSTVRVWEDDPQNEMCVD